MTSDTKQTEEAFKKSIPKAKGLLNYLKARSFVLDLHFILMYWTV